MFGLGIARGSARVAPAGAETRSRDSVIDAARQRAFGLVSRVVVVTTSSTRNSNSTSGRSVKSATAANASVTTSGSRICSARPRSANSPPMPSSLSIIECSAYRGSRVRSATFGEVSNIRT